MGVWVFPGLVMLLLKEDSNNYWDKEYSFLLTAALSSSLSLWWLRARRERI